MSNIASSNNDDLLLLTFLLTIFYWSLPGKKKYPLGVQTLKSKYKNEGENNLWMYSKLARLYIVYSGLTGLILKNANFFQHSS